jgi:hypothetical protein
LKCAIGKHGVLTLFGAKNDESTSIVMKHKFLSKYASATLCLLLLLPAIEASSKEPADIARMIKGAEFGIFHDFNAKKLVFIKTNYVPYKIGQDFGWRMPTKRTEKIFVREELILPSPAVFFESQSDENYLAVMDDRKTIINDHEISPENGYIYGGWGIAPDDPIGTHRLKVFIDGNLVKEFVFKIEQGNGGVE